MVTMPWSIPAFLWDIFVLSVLFGVAAYFSSLKLIRKFLLPSCLIAGLLGLTLSAIPWWSSAIVHSRFEFYVYHSLALLFVVMGLKKPVKKSRGAIKIGAIMVMTYLIQAIVGLLVLLVFVRWIDPNAIPALGLLLPLSFGMGPGTAFTIGQSWSSYGVENGGQIGLALASMGFVIAYLVGVGLLNLQSDPKFTDSKRRIDSATKNRVLNSSSIWTHFQLIALTFSIYGLALFLIHCAARGLTVFGFSSQTPILWSFHFLIAFFFSLLFRPLIQKISKREILSVELDNLVGFWAGLMIASSIIAINISLVKPHFALIISLVIPGGLATWWVVRTAINKSFKDNVFRRYLGLFGEMTGTLSSGLALVMATDPSFETPVARDMALGSAYALGFGFPLLALINAPLSVFQGSLLGYFVTFGACLAYFGLVYIVWSKLNSTEK